jgi:hypothetical protein
MIISLYSRHVFTLIQTEATMPYVEFKPVRGQRYSQRGLQTRSSVPITKLRRLKDKSIFPNLPNPTSERWVVIFVYSGLRTWETTIVDATFCTVQRQGWARAFFLSSKRFHALRRVSFHQRKALQGDNPNHFFALLCPVLSEFSASFQSTRTVRQAKRAWDAQRSVVLHPQNSPPRVPRPSQSTKCVPHYTSCDQDTLFGHLTVLPTAAWLHLKLSYLPFWFQDCRGAALGISMQEYQGSSGRPLGGQSRFPEDSCKFGRYCEGGFARHREIAWYLFRGGEGVNDEWRSGRCVSENLFLCEKWRELGNRHGRMINRRKI